VAFAHQEKIYQGSQPLSIHHRLAKAKSHDAQGMRHIEKAKHRNHRKYMHWMYCNH
jgi:hypothetical protein